MRSRFVCACFCCFLLLTTCSFAGDNGDYFPLSVGNTWVYQHQYWGDAAQSNLLSDSRTVTISVVSAVEIDGKTHYKIDIDGEIEYPEFLRNSGLYREDNGRIYRFEGADRYDFSEGLFFDLSEDMPENEHGVLCYHNDYQQCYVARTWAENELPIGVKQGYWFGIGCYLIVGWSYFIVPDIGIAYFHSAGESIEYDHFYSLVYARVNGREYGTSLTEEQANPVQATQMLPSFPNPFNSSTSIAFTLSSHGHAALTIYDITGRKVRELLSEELPAGAHRVVWDSCDDKGVTVSSGVYFARLNAGGVGVTSRMMFVK